MIVPSEELSYPNVAQSPSLGYLPFVTVLAPPLQKENTNDADYRRSKMRANQRHEPSNINLMSLLSPVASAIC